MLYAGGFWLNLNDDPAADNVAYFSGSAWYPMGSSAGACLCALNGRVHSLTANGTDVYVGTEALNVAGIGQADHVVRWNPAQAWSALGSNAGGTDGWFPSTAYIYALTSSGSKVYATGSFQDAGGDPTADNVAVFDGSAWHALGSNGAGNGPWIGEGHALAIFPNAEPRRLYAGGSFTSAGGDTQARGIASFSIDDGHPDADADADAGPDAGADARRRRRSRRLCRRRRRRPTPTRTEDHVPAPVEHGVPSGAVRPPVPGGAGRDRHDRDLHAVRAGLRAVHHRPLLDAGARSAGAASSARAPTAAGARCTRWTAVKGSFTVAGRKGVNKIVLRGRIGGRTLAPGSYRLNARETDLAANRSATRRTAFRIVR